MLTQDLHCEALFMLAVVCFLRFSAGLFVELLPVCTSVIVLVHFEVSFVEKQLISECRGFFF